MNQIAKIDDAAVPEAAGPRAAVDASADVVRTPLGQLLVAEGVLSDVQLHQALHLGTQSGERLGEVVVRQGLASEEDIARLLAAQWNLGYVDRASIWFDAGALARLSREDAQRLEAIPTRVEDGRVVVAVAEPTEQRLAALREVIGEDTVVVVVPKAALEAGLHSELLVSDGRAPLKLRHRAGSGSVVARLEVPPSTAADDAGWDADVLTGDVASEEARAASVAAPQAVERALPELHEAPPAGTLAEGLAQLIEAQIVAREPSPGVADRFSALERRLEHLEDDLAGDRAALAELAGHFRLIADLLGKL